MPSIRHLICLRADLDEESKEAVGAAVASVGGSPIQAKYLEIWGLSSLQFKDRYL
jgi:hypothetical protein